MGRGDPYTRLTYRPVGGGGGGGMRLRQRSIHCDGREVIVPAVL